MSCSSGGLNIENFTVYSNSTFRKQHIALTANGDSYDLTGWTVRMQIRNNDAETGTPLLEIDTDAATANGSVVTIEDAEDGELQLYINHQDIADLGPGSYVYDLLFIDTAGDRGPLLRGSFTILEGVTE